LTVSEANGADLIGRVASTCSKAGLSLFPSSTGGNRAMLQDFEINGMLAPLAQRYRVFAVDRPCFGHTSRTRSHIWTPNAQAELMDKALIRFDVEQAVVVGRAWGTLVALFPGGRPPSRRAKLWS